MLSPLPVGPTSPLSPRASRSHHRPLSSGLPEGCLAIQTQLRGLNPSHQSPGFKTQPREPNVGFSAVLRSALGCSEAAEAIGVCS